MSTPVFTGEGRLLTAPAAPFSAWALRFLEEVKDNDSFCISLSWAIEGDAALIVGADTGITGHTISTCDMITIWLFNIAIWYRWPIEIDGLPIKHSDFPWLC